MSFYSFAAANLTTAADRKRRPAVDTGQVLRTLALVSSLAALLVLMAHEQNHAAARVIAPAQQTMP